MKCNLLFTTLVGGSLLCLGAAYALNQESEFEPVRG